MPKDLSKPSQRTRTEELRREIGEAKLGWRRPLRSRNFALMACIWAGFVVVLSITALWARQQPLTEANRIASATRTVPADFLLPDEPATEQARSAAKLQAPRVYTVNGDVLEGLRKSLDGLPDALKNADNMVLVDPELAKKFALSEQTLQAVRQLISDKKIDEKWSSGVAKLNDLLEKTPILDDQTFQVEKTSTNAELELRIADRAPTLVRKSSALSADNSKLIDEMHKLAAAAGFQGPLLEVVAARLAWQPRATFTYNSQLSTARAEIAARAVQPITIGYRQGDVIFRRGEVLKSSQVHVYEKALEAERDSTGTWQLWTERAGVVGLVTTVTLAMAGYTYLFVPRVRRNPARMAAIAGFLAGSAVLACYASAAQPSLIALTSVAPVVFVAVILCVSYDQRVALAYAALHGLLVATALDLPVTTFAVMITGVAVWRLKEVRDRDALIKMGAWVAAAVGLGTLGATLILLPVTRPVLMQGVRDAALAAAGGLLVSGVTLFILPTLEKLFDITTGMTLVELRDPKQPLLRQLQQRAPGTYNHSLNLASLAEAGAEAVGANGLLAYVGALYHDIGKMNKPDYFVENQQPGFNRHDKLSPAMSLLVIVGHVKDGMELAREFSLARPLHHFIESHHGTTLVEYFYHRARRQAEAEAGASATGSIDEPVVPSELEYRYPGPKPRTKEAAIVMLCDAVESAARAMGDPTPARIDATVRAIANKRLMDGQFDDCDLTLRELNIIVEAVSRTLASIYHGRIAYPTLTASATAAQPGMHVLGPARGQPSAEITPGNGHTRADRPGITALVNPLGERR